jgi:sigma-E factor negative regulatory protein RseA
MSDTPRSADAHVSEALSALADGQADDAQMARALSAWREDPQARSHWQAIHLTGDALRSADLPLAGGSSDDAFLARMRERMAGEPVVLAPAALAPTLAPAAAVPGVAVSVASVASLRRRTWAGPLAMAASFVFLMSGLVALVQDNSGAIGGATGVQVAGANAPLQPASFHTPTTNTLSVDGALSSALTASLSSTLPTQPTGVSRVSFGANAKQGAGTQVVYAIALREDQLDAFWPEWRNQQAASRSLTTPSGMVMPVLVLQQPAH